jgi:translocation and assembly module TamB
MLSRSTPVSAKPSEAPERRGCLRRLAIVLLIAGAAVLLVLASLVIAIQTGPVRRYAVRKANEALRISPDLAIKLDGLDGVLPHCIILGEVVLSDGKGPWLRIENARIQWSVGAALRKRIHVSSLAADAVILVRKPAPAEEKPREEPFSIERAADFAYSLPFIRIDRIDLPRIVVQERVLGRRTALAAKGFASAGGKAQALSVQFQIGSVEGPALDAEFEASLTPTPRAADLRIALHEDSGGLMSEMAHFGDAGPLVAELSGKGPLSKWRGTAHVLLGDRLVLDSSLLLDIGATIGVVWQGKAQPPPGLLPEKARTVWTGPGNFDLSIIYAPGASLDVRRLSIAAAGVVARAEGVIGLGNTPSKLHLAAEVPDLASLEPLASIPLGGAASLTASVQGTINQPSGHAKLHLADLRLKDMTVSTVETDLSVEPIASDKTHYFGLKAQGEGRASGFTLPSVPDLDTGQATWSVRIETTRDGRLVLDLPLDVPALAATCHIAAASEAGQPEQRWKARLACTNLARFADLTGRALAGSAFVYAEGTTDWAGPVLDGSIRADVRGIEGLPAPAPELIGSAGGLEATVHLTEDRLLRVEQANAYGDAFSLNAAGNYNLDTRGFEGSLHGAIEDLETLESIVKRPLEGKAEIAGSASGTLDAFQAQAAVSSPGFAAGQVTFGPARADITVQGLPAKPNGRLKVNLSRGRDTLDAQGDFAYAAPHVAVSNLYLTAPGASLAGEIRMDTETRLASGRIEADAPDLTGLGRLLGVNLAGNAHVIIALNSAQTGQSIATTVNAQDIASPIGKARSLTLRADLDDALRAPQGPASAVVEGFTQGDLGIERIEATARGLGETIEYTVQGHGTWRESFDVDLTGSVMLETEAPTVVLAAFDAAYAEEKARLVEPVRLKITKEYSELDNLHLLLAGSDVLARGRLTPDHVQFDASIDGAPLGVLRYAGLPLLDGKAAARLQVEGAPSSPVAEAMLTIDQMRPAGDWAREGPAFAVKANSRLQDGRVETRLEATGLAAEPTAASVFLPVDVSLVPFRFALRQTDQLEGSAHLHADLQRVSDYHFLDGQSFAGMLSGSFQLDGTGLDPRFTGQASLAGGRYRNTFTGTMLDDVQMTAELHDQRLTITEFSATDGEKGTLEGAGWADMGEGIEFRLDASAKNAALVRLDELYAEASGDIQLKGTQKGASVAGTIELGPVEYLVPSAFGPDVPELDVVRVNQPGQANQKEQALPAPSQPYSVELTLDLDAPGKVYVRGRGLDSEWKGNLHITGSTENPRLTGDLSVLRGRFDFLQNRFFLENSRISFDGGIPPDPYLDVVAETEKNEISALVRARGPVSSPKIVLESEPPLPEEEILARLLFGRDLGNMTPLQALRLSAALHSLRGGGALFTVAQRTRAALNLDAIDLQSGGPTGAASLGVGKYLNERTYLQVRQGVRGDDAGVSVDVQLKESLRLKGQAAPEGQTGISLTWEYDY